MALSIFRTLFVVRNMSPSKYSRIRKNTHTRRSLKADCPRCSTKISASSSRRIAFQWLANLNIWTRVCSNSGELESNWPTESYSIIRELKGRTDLLNTTASLAALLVTQRSKSFLHQGVRFFKVSNSDFTNRETLTVIK